ncbi:MAG: hypothetical protein WD066_06685, partial [Planctomycetaceae bacterium]
RMENAMPERKDRQKPHEFTKIPEFDEAMQKLANVPKEAVEKREVTTASGRKRSRKPEGR